MICLTYIRNIVTHYNIRDGKIRRGSVRQMTDNKTVGDTTMLMNDEEVRHVVCPAGVHQLVELIATSV